MAKYPATSCGGRKLNASCEPGHVFVAHKADPGSSCPDSRNTLTTCTTSILGTIDQQCAGKRQCLDIYPDQQLRHSQDPKCKVESMSLAVTYVCVENSIDTTCSTSFNPEDKPGGFISLQLTECNAINIHANKGQSVQLAMLDPYAGDGLADPSECQRYFRVVEGDSETSVCRGTARWSTVYTSATNEIRLLFTKDDVTGIVLRYTYLGCPKYTANEGMYVLEQSDDVVDLNCLEGGSSWQLICEGNKWSGDSRQCRGAQYLSWSIAFAVVSLVLVALLMLVSLYFGKHYRFKRDAIPSSLYFTKSHRSVNLQSSPDRRSEFTQQSDVIYDTIGSRTASQTPDEDPQPSTSSVSPYRYSPSTMGAKVKEYFASTTSIKTRRHLMSSRSAKQQDGSASSTSAKQPHGTELAAAIQPSSEVPPVPNTQQNDTEHLVTKKEGTHACAIIAELHVSEHVLITKKRAEDGHICLVLSPSAHAPGDPLKDVLTQSVSEAYMFTCDAAPNMSAPYVNDNV